MGHFTWYEYFLGIPYKKSYLYASFTMMGFFVLLSIAGRIALGNGEAAIQPASRFSVKGFFEAITEGIYGLGEMIVGHRAARMTAHFAVLFTFIWISNLSALIPGMVTANANINAAIGLGLVSFFFYHAIGLAHGGWHYVAHFCGPILKWYALPLMALLFVIEIISHLVRPLSLGMRLSVNMTADHTIIATFVDLAGPYVVPIIFYGMGTFVSTMQAFLFTLLSMAYVALAVTEEEHH